ncbi:MAG: ATP-binding cassette domain-containing protein [Caldilineaceae bacterium]
MSARPVATPGAAILQVDDLHKRFTLSRRGLWGREQDAFVHAVDGVSFELARGEVLALVGESGCGKSTLALTLLGLEDPTSGSIRFEGAEITHQPPAAMKQVRRHMQMIFQDPYESLNPLMNVGDIVAEPLKVHGLAKERSERRARVIKLEDAGLKPAERFLARLPPRTVRRATPACGHRRGAGAGADAAAGGRAGLYARREHPRRDPQSPGRAADDAGHLHPLHHPRPGHGGRAGRPGGGDVPGPHRGTRADATGAPRPAAPVHARAALGRARAQSALAPPTHHPQRRNARPGQLAGRLPLSSTLSAGRGTLSPDGPRTRRSPGRGGLRCSTGRPSVA